MTTFIDLPTTIKFLNDYNLDVYIARDDSSYNENRWYVKLCGTDNGTKVETTQSAPSFEEALFSAASRLSLLIANGFSAFSEAALLRLSRTLSEKEEETSF